jgi:hypothetical protein
LDGAQSSLEEAMKCLEMGTESENSRIIIMKSMLFFRSYFKSYSSKKNNNHISKQPTLSGGQPLVVGHRGTPDTCLSIQEVTPMQLKWELILSNQIW